MEFLCNVLLTYSSEDFGNWTSGLGNFMIGIGTLFIAYAAVKKIPEKLARTHKNKETIEAYQKVVYRMYRKIEGSGEAITFSLPKENKLTTHKL